MQLTSATLDRTDLKETACGQRAQHECFRNSGVGRSKGKRRKWTFREAYIWPPGLGILTQTHALGLWIEKEYRKQEVGTEGKPKTMVSDFLVTGWPMLVGEESSVNWVSAPPPIGEQVSSHKGYDTYVYLYRWGSWDRLMQQSTHQSSTSNPSTASSRMPPVCPIVPLTDFLNLLEDRSVPSRHHILSNTITDGAIEALKRHRLFSTWLRELVHTWFQKQTSDLTHILWTIRPWGLMIKQDL